jgi:chromate transporter
VILATFIAMILMSRWLAPFYPPLGVAMAKINLLAFGGGYTAVALMYDQAVTAHSWVSRPEFIDGLAFSQVTPGPVIVTATFIGYKLGGFVGAAFATVCVILPSAVLLVALAPQFVRLRRITGMGRLVHGLLAAFMGMLLFVLWQVAAVGMTEPLTIALAIGAIVALRFKPNPIWIVLGAMTVALIFGR